MVATASTGYLPAADSADSITASAPSKMAVATSDTSARVGTGLLIIDSSIWVATTTGLPARRAARVMNFWMPGTRSSGISTPRSPRATISASVMSRISSSRVTACGFSILAITAARPRVIFLASAMSSGRWMNESADPVDAGVERGFEIGAILLRQRRERNRGVRQAHALAVRQVAADLDPRDDLAFGNLGRRQAHLAVVEQQRVAGLDRLEDLGMRQVHARDAARRLVGIERERRALRQHHRAAFELPDAKLRALQIDQDADRPLAFVLDRADGRHQLAHAVMRRVAHIDAEDVGAGAEQRGDHGTLGRRRAERGDDLGTAQTSHQFLRAGNGGAFLPPVVEGTGVSGTRDCSGCCGAWSAESVSCTVHDGCSPVSTSKKPVRS